MSNTIKISVKIFFFLLLFAFFDRGISTLLVQGLNQYFGLEKESQIAFIGHSHLLLSIDHKKIEQVTAKKVAKYTRAGVNVADRSAMIDHLIDKCPDIGLVVYGIDAWMFTGEGLSQNSYALFYPFMNTPAIDQYIYEQARIEDYWQRKILHTTRFDERLVSFAARGYLKNWDNLKYGTVDTLKIKQEISNGDFRKINSSLENREIFEASIEKLIDRGIDVLLIYTPTIDLYNEAEPKKFQEELKYFQNFASTSNRISLLYYLNSWSNRYELFFDPIHLNPKGQTEISDSLAIYINDNYYLNEK